MRALIFELRPESLRLEGLAAAVRKQADSLQARHELAVEVELAEEPDVDLNVKEAFYRITQEALHNIVKHARARRVRVRLGVNDGVLSLRIEDDGVGFEAGGEFPGHLGLRSMRERIEGLGGEFQLRSSPGEGMVLQASIQTDEGLRA